MNAIVAKQWLWRNAEDFVSKQGVCTGLVTFVTLLNVVCKKTFPVVNKTQILQTFQLRKLANTHSPGRKTFSHAIASSSIYGDF